MQALSLCLPTLSLTTTTIPAILHTHTHTHSCRRVTIQFQSADLFLFLMCNVGFLYLTAAPLSRQHTVDGEQVMIQQAQTVLSLPDLCVCRPADKQAEKGDFHCVFFQGCTPHGTLHRCVRCKLHCDIKKRNILLFFKVNISFLLFCTLN